MVLRGPEFEGEDCVYFKGPGLVVIAVSEASRYANSVGVPLAYLVDSPDLLKFVQSVYHGEEPGTKFIDGAIVQAWPMQELGLDGVGVQTTQVTGTR